MLQDLFFQSRSRHLKIGRRAGRLPVHLVGHNLHGVRNILIEPITAFATSPGKSLAGLCNR